MLYNENKLKLMDIALNEAKKAYSIGEVPVGAIIVKDNKIISKSHNKIQTKSSILYHAEIVAIDKAIKKLGSKYLFDCELYVTLEPCPMCAGAILFSKIKKVYISTKDPKSGYAGSIHNTLNNDKLNHRCDVEYGLRETESSILLKTFFKELRNSKKNN